MVGSFQVRCLDKRQGMLSSASKKTEESRPLKPIRGRNIRVAVTFG